MDSEAIVKALYFCAGCILSLHVWLLNRYLPILLLITVVTTATTQAQNATHYHLVWYSTSGIERWRFVSSAPEMPNREQDPERWDINMGWVQAGVWVYRLAAYAGNTFLGESANFQDPSGPPTNLRWNGTQWVLAQESSPFGDEPPEGWEVLIDAGDVVAWYPADATFGEGIFIIYGTRSPDGQVHIFDVPVEWTSGGEGQIEIGNATITLTDLEGQTLVLEDGDRIRLEISSGDDIRTIEVTIPEWQQLTAALQGVNAEYTITPVAVLRDLGDMGTVEIPIAAPPQSVSPGPLGAAQVMVPLPPLPPRPAPVPPPPEPATIPGPKYVAVPEAPGPGVANGSGEGEIGRDPYLDQTNDLPEWGPIEGIRERISAVSQRIGQIGSKLAGTFPIVAGADHIVLPSGHVVRPAIPPWVMTLITIAIHSIGVSVLYSLLRDALSS